MRGDHMKIKKRLHFRNRRLKTFYEIFCDPCEHYVEGHGCELECEREDAEQ